MPPAVTVTGLRELQAGFGRAETQTFGLNTGLRHAAEPVAADAERLASSSIRRMPRSPRWSRMRVGVTRTLIYVAPKQRGARGRGNPRSRPNLANLLMDRAMQPALDRHTDEIVAGVGELVDRITADFNR
jgi:hypothetical protein